MKTLPLNCNNCGAPLPVPESTRYLTCQFCDTRLEVVREGNAAFTKVLGELQERTDQISSEVRRLQLENELLKVEQNWDRESNDLKYRGQDGRGFEPSAAGGVFFIVLAVAAAIILLLLGEIFLGVFVGLFVGSLGILQIVAASNYEDSWRLYMRRKQQVLREISELPGTRKAKGPDRHNMPASSP
ncbi:MAG: hypothetical protein KDA69_09235 [Planctomycetaceae bacterium]|nr:hypothetical protein [Planctomycetaceae bacterium]MCA9044492.1 hypothetical protein [Planctomycetaceae bacterium]MCB9950504.1 hypothetical protein [Planctomycetaceae bacterium]